MDNRYYFREQTERFVIITNQEAQHLSKVRRAKIGDEIVAFNGDGFDYHLKINEITKDKVKAAKQFGILVAQQISLPQDYYFAGVKSSDGDESNELPRCC